MIYNMAGGKKLPELSNPATAADLLEGKQLIDADGNIVTGTIPSNNGQTITPGRIDKYVNSGQYLAGDIVIEGDSNLYDTNIKSGVTLFGVTGRYSGPADECVLLNSYSIGTDFIFSQNDNEWQLKMNNITDLDPTTVTHLSYSVYVMNTYSSDDYLVLSGAAYERYGSLWVFEGYSYYKGGGSDYSKIISVDEESLTVYAPSFNPIPSIYTENAWLMANIFWLHD